jgi:polyisoprenoid-binding protein YceI
VKKKKRKEKESFFFSLSSNFYPSFKILNSNLISLSFFFKNIPIMKILTKITTLASVILLSSNLLAQNVNSEKSLVEFDIMNNGKEVEGTFTGMIGTVMFNPSDLANSNFSICIDAATVNTKNDRRDTHLKTPDFFDVDTYSSICFESTKILKTEDNEADYVAVGNLTMHGVTKEIKANITYQKGMIKANFDLNRLDYKIAPNAPEKSIGYEVGLEINCVYNVKGRVGPSTN